MDQQKIGAYLRQLRLQRKLTQEQLAEQFHTTNRSISRWENGKSLPDISILIELADFYQVDVRTILDGEAKESTPKDNVKDVVSKIADYTDAKQSRLLHWIRLISLIGVFLIVGVLALLTFTYEPGILDFTCYVLCLFAFMAMAVLALYTNGLLSHLTKSKKIITACKIIVIALSATVILFIIRIILVFSLIILVESTPAKTFSGIENYDKTYYINTYGDDLDTGFFLFPDTTDNMINPEFDSKLKTGMFDTDGYMILIAEYTPEYYQTEIERLSSLECNITYNNKTVTQQVKYDTASYALPAYVTVDGYDYVYEYALLDDTNNTITYVLLSYPQTTGSPAYEEYLKSEISEYNISNVLDQFTIYAQSFDGGNSWIEYSDMMN